MRRDALDNRQGGHLQRIIIFIQIKLILQPSFYNLSLPPHHAQLIIPALRQPLTTHAQHMQSTPHLILRWISRILRSFSSILCFSLCV